MQSVQNGHQDDQQIRQVRTGQAALLDLFLVVVVAVTLLQPRSLAVLVVLRNLAFAFVDDVFRHYFHPNRLAITDVLVDHQQKVCLLHGAYNEAPTGRRGAGR